MRISGKIFRRFYVIFVARPTYIYIRQSLKGTTLPRRGFCYNYYLVLLPEAYHPEARNFPYMFETVLPIIPDQSESLNHFCPYKETQ